MMQWLRDMLRRSTGTPTADDRAMEAKVANLSNRAHTVVQHADRTLREAQALDTAMRAAEQAVRRHG